MRAITSAAWQARLTGDRWDRRLGRNRLRVERRHVSWGTVYEWSVTRWDRLREAFDSGDVPSLGRAQRKAFRAARFFDLTGHWPPYSMPLRWTGPFCYRRRAGLGRVRVKPLDQTG